MLHDALLQGMHGVFVPLRRKGTDRSNDRLRRQTLTEYTVMRQNTTRRHYKTKTYKAPSINY